MTSKNTAYARMLRERKPQRGAAHALMEDLADGLFRGPAKVEHGIDLVVLTAQAQRLTQEKLLAQLPNAAIPHLISRIGADDPATGILVFDGTMADALIEQQTLGRVSAAPRVDRAVTAIDAALSSAFATSIINKLENLTETRPIAKDLQGYSSGRPQIDRASLSLALDAKFYDVLQVELDLGPGLKRGQVQLAVPASAASDVVAAAKPGINPDMVRILQDAGLRLSVNLPPVKLSLKTLISLKADSVVDLPSEALSEASLVDTKGRKVATAKLGQFKGNRAVRVLSGPVVQTPKPAASIPEPATASIPATIDPVSEPADVDLGAGPDDLMPPDTIAAVS